MPMIQSLLIANRGEIACRIIRTCRAMGIRTVAVYSDADAKALHVRQADEAVHIGPSPASESYLCAEKIIAAALATGAEAIHPGYGFLSENAAFAQSVIDAGLIWVGPSPASITAMGLKDAAKALMAAAGVPVTPGYMGANQEPAFLAARAGEIGYPVLIKAVAGGGGKGMRKVEAAAEFADALASCQREALASFGNAHVLIEKYIQRPRHIEVQVFGDTHGNVVHLFERDCSLQRRHQKVIEEAPAPGMDEATRAALCAVAVKAARAVDYVGAGTIEFIADASDGLRADRIWFMEMNTRLQVEHPVTERITGIDLVAWQLRVASGEPLPRRQDELKIMGWAMEARLYAEDPAKDFLPSVGRLEHFVLESIPLDGFSEAQGAFGRIRVDTGVCEGDAISPFYDPMIAKIVAHSGDRSRVISLLGQKCRDVQCWPVKTNASFLAKILAHQEFIAGNFDTGFIERNVAELTTDGSFSAVQSLKNVMVHRGLFQHVNALSGFRLNAEPCTQIRLFVDGIATMVENPVIGRHVQSSPFIKGRRPGSFELGDFIEVEDGIVGFDHGTAHRVTTAVRGRSSGTPSIGAIIAPMPGKVIAVEVTAGQAVIKGQKLLVLEAMKMEHALTAPFDGIVAELQVQAGGQVQVDALLARIAPISD